MRNIFEYHDEGIYLEHHGIKGQKWGIRRFQNRDGSLTAEGKKRYSNNYTENDLKKDVASFVEYVNKPYELKRNADDNEWVEAKHRQARIRENVAPLKKIVNDAIEQAKKIDDLYDSGNRKAIDEISDKVNSLYQDYRNEFAKIIKQYSGTELEPGSLLDMYIDEDFWLQIPNFGY